MTYTVKYELYQECILEFDDQEEFEEWDDNGACIDDATITLCKSNVEVTPIDEEDDQ